MGTKKGALGRREGVMGRCAAVCAVGAVLAGFSAAATAGDPGAGAVYVLTNQAANSVLVYARAADGTLAFPPQSVSTDGVGMGTGGDPLGAQNSLVLGRWHRLLFAVNAGSNDVSVFSVRDHGLRLRLLDRARSRGTMPVSVAVHGRLVYVLNAGGTAPSIQGFILDPDGDHLVHLAGSRRHLPGGSGSAAAQVAFSPDGDVLVVTEKNTNKLDTWTVDDDGRPEDGMTTDSSGAVPFGFTFARRDFAIVTEAAPSALSSYELDDSGELELQTATLPDKGKANCWVVVTRNGRFAFTTNTASGTISSYRISKEGWLSLLGAVAANTGSGTAPIDEALSANSRFLYVREATKGQVHGFRVGHDGSLTPVNSAGGVPVGSQGVAAF